MPQKSEADYHQVWDHYSELQAEIRDAIGDAGDYSPLDERRITFMRKGYAQGPIPPDMAAEVIDNLPTCRRERIVGDLVHPQMRYSVFKNEEKLKQVDSTVAFIRPSQWSLWLMTNILDEIKDDVASALASPWRVLNVRLWLQEAGVRRDFGQNSWHKDGLPREVFKVLLYLTPMNLQHGTLKVQHSDGEQVTLDTGVPTWVLLKPSELLHAGHPPEDENCERIAAEVTVTPSAAFDTTARFLGHNVRYSYYPWHRHYCDGVWEPPVVSRD